jgi:hypothetical protein
MEISGILDARSLRNAARKPRERQVAAIELRQDGEKGRKFIGVNTE